MNENEILFRGRRREEKTGLAKRDVADWIIAYDQATGLLEQRIA